MESSVKPAASFPPEWNPESARDWISRRVAAFSNARAEALAAFDEVVALLDGGARGFVVAHAGNASYAGAWLAAASHRAPVRCANPKWGDSEWTEAMALIPESGVVVGKDCGPATGSARRVSDAGASDPRCTIPGPHSLYIPTGGTGGRVRFVAHSPATLAAAVSGFSTYAGDRLLGSGRPARLHAVQALPCCHVSGLMPVVRAWLTDAEVVFTSPSFRPGELLPAMPHSADGVTVVSLVAAQLHRLLDRADGPEWLREAGLVLVGGSSVASELLARARAERLPLGVSYGLTEAAALTALYPPESFLRGETPVAGELLPHIRATITPDGRVALAGESLAADLPRDAEGRFVTGDEGFLDTRGRLVVTGRADRIIISGGEKIDPVEVEAAIRATGLVREVFVTSEPNPEWGRRLVAVYVGEFEPQELSSKLEGRWSPHRVPRRWIRSVASLFDEKGKISTRLLNKLLDKAF